MAQTELLHESLQELIGLHRQLYETVKAENEAITNADLKLTYEASTSKEALIHWIHNAEINRQAIVFKLAGEEKLSSTTPSLRELILHYQSSDAELSAKYQTDLTTLMILVERIKKQNAANAQLIDSSLKHVNNMKKNIFGETTHQAKTYNQQGKRNEANANAHGPRLISKEV